jgi:hypothetical protein
MPKYDEHLVCIACLPDQHLVDKCTMCRQIPVDILNLRRQAALVKKAVAKKPPMWREAFYKSYPALLSEEERDAFDEALKRKAVAGEADGPSSKKSKEDVEQVGEKDTDSSEPPVPDVSVGNPIDEMSVIELRQLVKGMSEQMDKLQKAKDIQDSHELLEEDDSVNKKLSMQERRAVYMSIIRKVHPDLQCPEPFVEVPQKSGSSVFRALMPSEGSPDMPFCPPLLAYMDLLSKPLPKGAKKPEPHKSIDKFYTVHGNVESVFLKPRVVNDELIDVVDKSKIQNIGATGGEIRLKASSPAGQRELDALRQFTYASSLLRVANTQELSVQGVNVFTERITQVLGLLMGADQVPEQIMDNLIEMQSSLTSLERLMEDMSTANAYLAKALSVMFVEAIRERRGAWVSSATLPEGMRTELLRAPLHLLSPEEKAALNLLPPDSAKNIERHKKQVKEDSMVAAVTAAANKAPPPRFNNRPRPKGRGRQGSKLSWGGASQPANGDRRPGNRAAQPRPQGGRGRGRGKYQQPFSGAQASEMHK